MLNNMLLNPIFLKFKEKYYIMKKYKPTLLSLNKSKVSSLNAAILKGGQIRRSDNPNQTMTCCDYSCSCDTIDTNLTANCTKRPTFG